MIMKMLTEPIDINGMKLKNRLVMAPVATSNCPGGFVTDELLQHYQEKTKNGCLGLVVTEYAYISPDGITNIGQMSLSRDADVEGLKRLTDVIHQNGTCVMAQINHTGNGYNPAYPIKNPLKVCENDNMQKGPAKVIDAEDIKRLRDNFTAAARRAKEAGYDAVEIHAAHGFLLNQFYSPLSNHRTDEYGGCLSNRLRLLVEIIRDIRSEVGDHFPISMRFGGCDYMDGGSSIDNAADAALELEEAGLDLLDLSGGFCGSRKFESKELGFFRDMAQEVKPMVEIPVMLAGGLHEPALVEDILSAGEADLIAIARPIMRDSDFTRRMLLGEL